MSVSVLGVLAASPGSGDAVYSRSTEFAACPSVAGPTRIT